MGWLLLLLPVVVGSSNACADFYRRSPWDREIRRDLLTLGSSPAHWTLRWRRSPFNASAVWSWPLIRLISGRSGDQTRFVGDCIRYDGFRCARNVRRGGVTPPAGMKSLFAPLGSAHSQHMLPLFQGEIARHMLIW